MKKKKRAWQIVLTIILILMTPRLLNHLSLGTLLHNDVFYRQTFAATGVDVEKATAANKNILDYYYGKADLGVGGLTEAETKHLADVKKVWHFMMWFIFIYMAAWFLLFPFSNMKAVLIWGGLLAAVAPLIASLFPFEWLFNLFHSMFFSAGTWQFPETSVLLQTYKPLFFELFFRRMMLQAAAFGLITAFLGLLMKKKD